MGGQQGKLGDRCLMEETSSFARNSTTRPVPNMVNNFFCFGPIIAFWANLVRKIKIVYLRLNLAFGLI